MLVVRLSQSCTTGWLDWGHGELWLTQDSIVRVGRLSLTINAIVSSSTAGIVREIVDSGEAGLAPGLVDDDAWASYLARSGRRAREIRLDSVVAGTLARGISTSCLSVTMSDGRRYKLLWLRTSPLVLKLLDRAVHRREEHQEAFTFTEIDLRESADDYRRFEGLRYRHSWLEDADPLAVAATVDDLHRLPTHVQSSVEIVTAGQASWPQRDGEAALRALTDLGRVVRVAAADPQDGIGRRSDILQIAHFDGDDPFGSYASLVSLVEKVRPDRRIVLLWGVDPSRL